MQLSFSAGAPPISWAPPLLHFPRVSLAFEDPQCLYVYVERFNMDGYTRPAHNHYWLHLPPFDLSDHVETHQQTLELLGNLYRILRVVASRILLPLELVTLVMALPNILI